MSPDLPPPAISLPDKTEICIIGGGIVGVLSALELATHGHHVVLVEQDTIGWAQSGRNLGWIRQQGRDRSEMPLMIEANARWREMARRCESSALNYSETGICYFGAGQRDQDTYETYHAELGEHGVISEMLNTAEIQRMQPGNSLQWQVGIRTPSDGRIEPKTAAPAIATAARRAGAVTVENCAVRAIEPNASGGVWVYTERGELFAERVVVAAGASSAKLLLPLGLSLPQLCIESTVIEVVDGTSSWSGSGSDGLLAFYRNEHGHIGLSLCDRFVHRPTLETARHLRHYLSVIDKCLAVTTLAPPRRHVEKQGPPPQRKNIRQSLERAQARAIIGHDAKIVRCWAGVIDLLPDFLPVIDKVGTSGSILITTGFSGHGFGIAPTVARVVNDWVAERSPNHDLSRFRYNRFSDGTHLEPGPTF